MKGYIYKYTFPDGKVYIGQTRRPIEARHKEHTNPSTGHVNVGFWEAWQRFKEAKLEILDTVEDEDLNILAGKLNHIETQRIADYQATDPQYGYNRVFYGKVTSAVYRALMKKYRHVFPKFWGEREQFYQQLEQKVYDSFDEAINLSDEELALIRDEAIPIVFPSYQKYIRLSDGGSLSIKGRGFNAEEAFEWLLFAVRDLRNSEYMAYDDAVRQFLISRVDEIMDEGAIQAFDKDGNLIKEYRTIAEVMHDLNLKSPANVYNALEGKQKTAYGYIWRKKNSK